MEQSNRYLLDTQIFIWWMEKAAKLHQKIKAVLADPENQIFLSVGSVWEMMIKKAKKKLKLPKDVEAGITQSGFTLLPVELTHVLQLETLPNLHKDPFDRLLIAQALVEKLTLITSDEKMWKYQADILKA